MKWCISDSFPHLLPPLLNKRVCVCVCVCVCVSPSLVSDSCWPHGCSPPGCSVQGILRARILEWVAIFFSRGTSRPRDQTWVFCVADRFLTIWATRNNWFVLIRMQERSIHCIWLFTSLKFLFFYINKYFSLLLK